MSKLATVVWLDSQETKFQKYSIITRCFGISSKDFFRKYIWKIYYYNLNFILILPKTAMVIPNIMSKDPTVTARQACHKQAVDTWPSVLKEVNKGLAEGPLPPWLIKGPQYFWSPSPSVSSVEEKIKYKSFHHQEWTSSYISSYIPIEDARLVLPEVILERNSNSVFVVNLTLLAHFRQWPRIHHQAVEKRSLTSEAMEASVLTLDLSESQPSREVSVSEAVVVAKRMEAVVPHSAATWKRKKKVLQYFFGIFFLLL